MPRKRKKSARGIKINEWDVDESNASELAGHGLSVETVDDIASARPRFRRNKKGRAATHQMIGPDAGGAFWVVCIVEQTPERWRPITGWPAGPHEIEWWRRSQ